MPVNSYNTYESVNKEGLSTRELEASVLTKAGVMLKRCQEQWDAEDSETRLDAAIKYNQMIWSFFQSELMQEDNPLPKQLRQDILNLSLFIDNCLFNIIAYPSPEKLTPVIDINFNLAAGLRAKPEVVEVQQASGE
jgi:flagellar protein FlaF